MNKKIYRISKFKVSGIKSIKDKIEIDFLSNPNVINFPYEGNVKAFYGENGSGKSAIIHSFDILHKLLNDDNYLSSKEGQKTLIELKNKSSNEISLYISYLIFDFDQDLNTHDTRASRYLDYTVTLSVNKSGQFYISQQCLERYKQGDIKKSKKPLYKFQSHEDDVILNESSNLLNQKLQNQILSKSISILISDIVEESLPKIFNSIKAKEKGAKNLEQIVIESLKLDNIDAKKFINEMGIYFDISNILLNITIFVGDEDRINVVKPSYSKDGLEQFKKAIDTETYSIRYSSLDQYDVDEHVEFQELLELDMHSNDVYTSRFIIPRESKEKFVRDMNYRTEIIRLFKPEIKSLAPIYTDISEKNKFIIANIGFDYGDYVVPLYLESSGTRKLFEFSHSIKHLFKGGIVIFDELDSGLHDVILSRLVEFVSKNCVGQLIFTTHNLAPMSVLENKKDSIDFINRDHEIVKWTKRGNSNAINFYRSGKVKGIPHNISADDFLRILGSVESD